MIRLVALLLLASSASAAVRARLEGYCEDGNQAVSTTGNPVVNSTTRVQRSYPSCTVTVYAAGTLTLSTLYADDAGTAKANPFTAASNGYWFFYADDGRYDVKLSGGGISAPFTWGDMQLLDRRFQLTATGGTARNLKDKLNEIVTSVKDFGAVGDGTTSDQSALTNALASCIGASFVASSSTSNAVAGGCTVFVPYGKYRITSTILLPNSTTLQGTGWGSILWFDPTVAGTAAIKPDPASTNSGESVQSWQDIHVIGINLINSYTSIVAGVPAYDNDAGDGIDFRNVRLASIERSIVQGFDNANTYAMRFGFSGAATWSYFNRIVQVTGKNNWRSIQLDNGANGIQVIGGEFGDDSLFGPTNTKTYEMVDNGGGTSVVGATFEGAPSTAHIQSICSGAAFIGNYVESVLTPNAIFVEASRADNAGGCSFRGNTLQGINVNPYKFAETAADSGSSTFNNGYDPEHGSPTPYPVSIINQRFNQGVNASNGWTHDNGGGANNIQWQWTGYGGNRDGIILKAHGGVLNRIYANFTTGPEMQGQTIYVSFWYKESRSGTSNLRIVPPNSVSKLARPMLQLSTSGWRLAVVQGQITDWTTATTIYIEQTTSSQANDTLEVANIQFWRNGFAVAPGMTSYFINELTTSGAPALGTWLVGDQLTKSTLTTGSAGRTDIYRYICTVQGTAGTLNGGATTGGININTPTLTVNTANYLTVGQFITIAGVTGVKQIKTISSLTVTLTSNADATVAAAAVAYSNPTFKTLSQDVQTLWDSDQNILTVAANGTGNVKIGNPANANSSMLSLNGTLALTTGLGFYQQGGDGILHANVPTGSQFRFEEAASIQWAIISKTFGTTGTTFAALPASSVGYMTFCTDCNIANPCTGGGTGAWAFRVAGATWRCPF